jgi:hypothetical protein
MAASSGFMAGSLRLAVRAAVPRGAVPLGAGRASDS